MVSTVKSQNPEPPVLRLAGQRSDNYEFYFPYWGLARRGPEKVGGSARKWGGDRGLGSNGEVKGIWVLSCYFLVSHCWVSWTWRLVFSVSHSSLILSVLLKSFIMHSLHKYPNNTKAVTSPILSEIPQWTSYKTRDSISFQLGGITGRKRSSLWWGQVHYWSVLLTSTVSGTQ